LQPNELIYLVNAAIAEIVNYSDNLAYPAEVAPRSKWRPVQLFVLVRPIIA